ncbi:hypothetical protein [Nocardiopsis lambiniae]|uniref:Ferric reductase n=1 Tax=Nocardiopsis lambiniae TaxID=3075539 RepID=A0ABU2M8J7_9ACTN|nr:hypothetical protein [Nocardiopsis sp. DSM 44743]MDT0328981.1 hypothetical protein [Nocardiopsis sp. DSM 44743]
MFDLLQRLRGRPAPRVRRPLATRADRRIRLGPWPSLLIGIVAANTLLALTAPGHAVLLRHVQDLLWSSSGVLALVGLTAATVLGLAAADRLVAAPRARALLQAAHRSVALISVGFLVAHVVLQIAFTGLLPRHALLPWGVDPAVACGIIATDLLLIITVTGMLRGGFVGGARPWAWRLVHVSAYLCWPLALVHGLTAGRTVPGWVLICYLLCLLAVCAALVVRLVVTGRPHRTGEGRRAASEPLVPPAPPDEGAVGDELAFWSSLRPGGRP